MAGWVSDGPDVFARYRQRPREGRKPDSPRWASPHAGRRGRQREPSPHRGRAVGRGDHGDGDGDGHATLVGLIKQGQRASPAWRDLWWRHCESFGAAHDPALSDTEFLSAAIAKIGLPQQAEGSGQASRRDGGRGRRRRRQETHTALVEELNDLQRVRPRCRNLWREYCEAYGNGSYNPQRHDEDFIETAIGWLRESTDPPPRHADAEEADGQVRDREHEALITAVKDRQRESTGFAEHWRRLCDEHGEGYYDPTWYGPHFLSRALRGSRSRGGGGGGRGGGRSEPREKTHAELVEDVKQVQRDRPSARDLWRQYCDRHGDGNYDPSRHNRDFLDTALWWISQKTAAEPQRRGRAAPAGGQLRHEIQPLCDARRKAQHSRAFERADELRAMLKQMGVELDDRRGVWRHRESGLSGSYKD